MQFPDSCLEDWWLEFLGTKQNWIGLINPLTISLESFDKNILKSLKRWFRVYDWMIKLIKEDFFRNQNEIKKKFYQSQFKIILFYPLKIIFYPFLLSFSVFIAIQYWTIIFSHYEYIILLSSLFIVIFVNYVIKLINYWLILRKKTFIFLFFKFLLETSIFWYSGFRFFKAFCLSKYSTFHSKNNQEKKDIKNTLYIFLLILCLITIFNLTFIFLHIYKINSFLFFLFIFVNIILIWILLSIWSFFILYLSSFIKTNKTYNKNNFIYI